MTTRAARTTTVLEMTTRMRPAVRMGRCIARNTGDMTSPVLAMNRLMKNDLICAQRH